MLDDPILRELRDVRETYAASFGGDVLAMLRDLKTKQRDDVACGARYVSLPPKRVAPVVAASCGSPHR